MKISDIEEKISKMASIEEDWMEATYHQLFPDNEEPLTNDKKLEGSGIDASKLYTKYYYLFIYEHRSSESPWKKLL